MLKLPISLLLLFITSRPVWSRASPQVSLGLGAGSARGLYDQIVRKINQGHSAQNNQPQQAEARQSQPQQQQEQFPAPQFQFQQNKQQFRQNTRPQQQHAPRFQSQGTQSQLTPNQFQQIPQQFQQNPQQFQQNNPQQFQQPFSQGEFYRHQQQPDVLEEPVFPPTSPAQLPFYPDASDATPSQPLTTTQTQPQPIFPEIPRQQPLQPAQHAFQPKEAQVGSISFRAKEQKFEAVPAFEQRFEAVPAVGRRFEAVPAVPIFPDLPDPDQPAGRPYSLTAQAELERRANAERLAEIALSRAEELEEEKRNSGYVAFARFEVRPEPSEATPFCERRENRRKCRGEQIRREG